MLTIRLSRIGKKNKPQFRVVVQEKSKATTSRFIEQVGFYNPHKEQDSIQLEKERIKYWLSRGAQASPTVFNILVANKIVAGPSIPVGRPKKKKKEEKPSEGEKEEAKKKKREETKEEPKEELKKEEPPKSEKQNNTESLKQQKEEPKEK